MSAPAKVEHDTPVTAVPVQRSITYLKWCRAAVWFLCIGGVLMGFFVARAQRLQGRPWTFLEDHTWHWPILYGALLAGLGFVSLLGRMVGVHGTQISFRGRFAFVVDGNLMASVAMRGMALWYVIWASSLIVGDAEYAFVPYYLIAVMHYIFAHLVRSTDGFRPSGWS